MIPGFNTDVTHDGITYHVQTEDKGVDAPVILSLVYHGGAILASKRTPYDDLILIDFDESALVDRLQRQHKLICAAIRNGRIEDLKRLNERTPDECPPVKTPAAAAVATAAEESSAQPVMAAMLPSTTRVVKTGVADFARREVTGDAPVLTLAVEEVLRAGETHTLQVRLSRGAHVLQKVNVRMKALGTAFNQFEIEAVTDADGVATFRVTIPSFTVGRGVLLMSAMYDNHEVLLRRLIQPV